MTIQNIYINCTVHRKFGLYLFFAGLIFCMFNSTTSIRWLYFPRWGKKSFWVSCLMERLNFSAVRRFKRFLHLQLTRAYIFEFFLAGRLFHLLLWIYDLAEMKQPWFKHSTLDNYGPFLFSNIKVNTRVGKISALFGMLCDSRIWAERFFVSYLRSALITGLLS